MRIRIEAAARQLFVSEGYGSISMRRLAKEVGCTPMTLYKYYDNKVDILGRLWDLVFEELFEQLNRIAAVHADPLTRLKAVSTAYVMYWLENREHYRMVFMTEGISQPDVSLFVSDSILLERFLLFHDLIAGALKLDDNDPGLQEKNDFLLSCLHGIAHCQITISGYPWTEPKTLVEAAVAGLL